MRNTTTWLKIERDLETIAKDQRVAREDREHAAWLLARLRAERTQQYATDEAVMN